MQYDKHLQLRAAADGDNFSAAVRSFIDEATGNAARVRHALRPRLGTIALHAAMLRGCLRSDEAGQRLDAIDQAVMEAEQLLAKITAPPQLE